MFSVINDNGQLNKNWNFDIKKIHVNPDQKILFVSIMGNQSSGKSLLISIFFFVIIFLFLLNNGVIC
jgi:hypothetical protein